MKKTSLVALIVFIVVAIILSPIATIWSLNTLFGLGIELNFFTWVSVFWLTLFVIPKKIG